MEELYRSGDFGGGEWLAENEEGTPVRLAKSWKNRVDRLTEVEKIGKSSVGGGIASSAFTLDPVHTSQSSNQPLEPTRVAVMPTATALVTPATRAAHL